jgi:hypothetical protein
VFASFIFLFFVFMASKKKKVIFHLATIYNHIGSIKKREIR